MKIPKAIQVVMSAHQKSPDKLFNNYKYVPLYGIDKSK